MLCSSSPKYKNLIETILNDDLKNFKRNIPINLYGKIDKMLVINFLLSCNSIKIFKNIINNPSLRGTIIWDIRSVELLLNNKNISYKEKTYIYTKIIKKTVKISEKKLLKIITANNLQYLNWLETTTLEFSDYVKLFDYEINEYNISFCRDKKQNIIKILLFAHKKNIINFEDYTSYFKESELIQLIDQSLKYIKKQDLELNLNLLDSIIKILTTNQKLIEKIEINNLFNNILIENNMFSFLNMDIEKILLYKKFSKTTFMKKSKVKKI